MASKSGASCETRKELDGSGNGGLLRNFGGWGIFICHHSRDDGAEKKQKNREVFEQIQNHLKTALADPAFVEEN